MRLRHVVTGLGCSLSLSIALSIPGATTAHAEEAPEREEAEAPPARARPVHVRIRHRNRDQVGGVRIARDDGTSALCMLPCEVDVPSGTPLRVIFEGDTHDFTVAGGPGESVDVVVGPKHRAGYYVGAAGMMVGGTALMGGGGFLIFASMFSGFSSNNRQSGAPLAVGGTLAIAGGIALIAWGIVRAADGGIGVEQRRPSPPPFSYEARSDAPARAEVPLTASAPPATLQLGFSF